MLQKMEITGLLCEGGGPIKDGRGYYGAHSSPFPLTFSFSLVSPGGNLFTVNTALMSRKDPKCYGGGGAQS